MPEKSDNPHNFWQELKRRNVFRTIAMYAASAFIALEAVDIIFPRWGLPGWTINLVILLLIIGLFVTAILAWIFDITPAGIQKTEPAAFIEEKESVIRKRRKLRLSDVIIAVLLLMVLILLYPKVFRRNKLESFRNKEGYISVSVMPFKNMTNDSALNIWQDGIQNLLITSLSNSEELKVNHPESVSGLLQNQGLTNYASLTPSTASTISRKLDANVLILGSVNKAGTSIRVNVQLINPQTEELFKSFQADGTTETILSIADTLSIRIKNFLIISHLGKELTSGFQKIITTSSPEAFRYFIYGQNAFNKTDYTAATEYFSRAIRIDTGFYAAFLGLSYSYFSQSAYKEAKKLCMWLYQERQQMPMEMQIRVNHFYACLFLTPHEEIKYLKQLLEFDDKWPGTYHNIAAAYLRLQQYDKVIPEVEKALDIYDKWDTKPLSTEDYILLGTAYHKTGQDRKEKKLYKKAQRDFPDDPDLIKSLAVLSLIEKDTIAAEKYIEKYISIRRENSWPEAVITTILATIYFEADMLDKSEEYFRQALSLDPFNPHGLYNLAWFLIYNDQNIDDGMELIDKALETNPQDYTFLHIKGLGLYKQNKYEEALECLEKSWELKPVYDHTLYLHLEAAKKAVADQKGEQ